MRRSSDFFIVSLSNALLWISVDCKMEKKHDKIYMACYVISFEPLDTDAAKTIRDRLKTFNTYCPINSYCWAVVTDKTATQVRDLLSAGLPLTRIFVIRSGTEAAWRRAYSERHNEWLKKLLIAWARNRSSLTETRDRIRERIEEPDVVVTAGSVSELQAELKELINMEPPSEPKE